MYKITRYSNNKECGTVIFDSKDTMLKFIGSVLGNNAKYKKIKTDIDRDFFPISFEAIDWMFYYTFEYSIKEE